MPNRLHVWHTSHFATNKSETLSKSLTDRNGGNRPSPASLYIQAKPATIALPIALTRENTMTAFIVGYMRYSSDMQALGSSEARQADGYAGAVKMTGLTAWHKVYIDRGASGYFGEHLEGQFGALLRDVEARVFPSGSVIWFEAPDRMTRQGNEAAARYSRIITTNGYGLQFGCGQIRTEDTGEMETVGDVVLSMAAREYSKLLQKRLLKANQEKRDKGTTHLTKHKRASKACPSWLEPLEAPDANGYWFKFNERANIIREACLLSIGGMGVNTIRRHLGLTDDKQWGGLRTILTGSVGLYGMRQNCLKGKVKQGMTACYPPLISEAEFFAMRAAQRDRARNLGAHGGGGRSGTFVTCLFTGKLFYADGSPMTLTSQGAKCKPVLKPVRTKKVRPIEYTRLDNGTCEMTLLAMIGSEVSASDLFPRKQTSNAELRVKEIEGQIVILESKVADLTEEFLSATGSGLAKLILATEAKIETLKAEREKAIVEVNQSRNDVLSQTKDLLTVLDTLTGQELLTARTLLKNTLIPALVKSVHIDVRSAHDATYTVTLVSGAKWTGDSAGWKGGEVAVMSEVG
jgi:DNA invertase Pin-like site-specific DNA recombinase